MWAKTYRWLIKAGEWAVLLPVWRKLLGDSNRSGAAAIVTGGVWLVAILIAGAIVSGGGDGDSAPGENAAAAKASATARGTASPARSGTPSPAPRGTQEATPQPSPTPGLAPAAATPPPGSADGGAPPAPGQILTIVSSSTYTDDVGGLHVAGEVRNNGGEYLEFVEITGTFFNADGQVAAYESTFTHADLVAPSEVAGFDLAVSGGASLGISRYELAVQGEVAAERPVSGLVVQVENSSVDTGGDLHVVGTVVNQSAGPAEFVKVIGTFYGPDGTVMRSDFAYTELDEIPPGGIDTFDLVLPGGGAAGFARYELKVEGFPV